MLQKWKIHSNSLSFWSNGAFSRALRTPFCTQEIKLQGQESQFPKIHLICSENTTIDKGRLHLRTNAMPRGGPSCLQLVSRAANTEDLTFS